MSLKLKITFDENRMGQVDQIDAQDSENSCDEDNDEGNGQTFDSMTSLKRKRSYRQSDIVYTSQKIFDSYQEATQYVDSMGIWKFERNRPTKKGSKGFYHCKMSDECKAKIYLLMDPQSSFVVLYQNNVDHDHSFYSQLKKKQIENVLTETKSEIDKEESMPVEIVNDDDFEDSLVDLFDESNENKTSKFSFNFLIIFSRFIKIMTHCMRTLFRLSRQILVLLKKIVPLNSTSIKKS